MTSIPIKNAKFVIIMDKDRRIIKNDAVAIDGDKIIAVGKNDELKKNIPLLSK